jgi:hypothetical protein
LLAEEVRGPAAMTVEPLDHQALLSRRALLFSPSPRLGWSFRDRWLFRVPFTEPRPRPQPLPDYLHRQVAQTEQLARRRLSRALPISAALFIVLALFSACAAGDFMFAQTATPALVLAIICALPGGALTGMALLARRNAREAYALAVRQTRETFETADRTWQQRRSAHEQAEHARINAMPEWGAVPRPASRGRLDVFGGTLWSWEALLTTYGTSTLADQPLLVLDLSREVVCTELAMLARAAGVFVDAQMLPTQLAQSSLLSGLGTRELIDAVVESMHADNPEATRAERSMDDRILTKVCDALGDDVTLGRIAASLRALMGEPDNSEVLGRDERRRIGNELFSVEYRRQAHANISRIESYIHPLETLGTEQPEDRDTGYLTCIALDSHARNVRSELLTDLLVQWVTHRVAASATSRPSVIVAGADELAARHLERLSDACERRGVPLTFLFRRLAETSSHMLGAGATAFMRLGNHDEATRAADFIGRDYKFVLSQITKNVGGNESHTETDTEGEGDADTISVSDSTGTSTNWGTNRSSGVTHSGGGMFGFFPDRSTSTGTSRTRGGGTSDTHTRGTSRSTSRNWSSAYSYATGTNWSDADTTQRVYEYTVEPVVLQHLPDHALLLVESAPHGRRRLTPVECDPAIVTLDRVTTDPLPDPPPPPRPASEPAGAPAAGVPNPQQWANPPAVEPPRPPLPYMPGAPSGQQSGPYAPTQHHDRGQPPRADRGWRPDQDRPPEDGPGRRPGPPPLFGRHND